MNDITIPKSDKGYAVEFTLTDADGAALDLSGYTIKLKAWAPGVPGTLIVNGTCSSANPGTGICTYTLTGSEFSTAGRYLAEIELTVGSSVVESTEQFLIIVKESG